MIRTLKNEANHAVLQISYEIVVFQSDEVISSGQSMSAMSGQTITRHLCPRDGEVLSMWSLKNRENTSTINYGADNGYSVKDN